MTPVIQWDYHKLHWTKYNEVLFNVPKTEEMMVNFGRWKVHHQVVIVSGDTS